MSIGVDATKFNGIEDGTNKRGKTREGEVSDDRRGKTKETIKTTVTEDTISSNDCHDSGHKHGENGN